MNCLSTENWVFISGYGDKYQVSDEGRVRSFHRGDMKILNCQTSRRSGYKAVQLWDKGKCKVALVHTLVLESFVSQRPTNLVCNHKDGNKLNNFVGNLEWVTRSDNTIHSIVVLGNKHGNRTNHIRGESHYCAKLTKAQSDEIKKKYRKNEYGVRRLAKEYGVRPYTIYGIVNETTWKG